MEGKSRLIHCFQPNLCPNDLLPQPSPTLGFCVKTVGIAGVNYHFYEGSYSSMWHISADIILWVVDSSDHAAISQSTEALHQWIVKVDFVSRLKSEDGLAKSLYGVPVVIVAAKQDISDSISPDDVLRELNVEKLRLKHRVYIVGTRIPDKGHRQGLWRLYELITYMEKERFFEKN
ncbi:hypothetical protein MAR_015765 [Mya arenaria]|uniref:Uncharacterized protein n=1 Tax=Mya arenaria TaxID=6604 RepID=A0ABY7FRE4_MYAAR|nr:hypothetical protein MAR_015765 [Mya arenaria]